MAQSIPMWAWIAAAAVQVVGGIMQSRAAAKAAEASAAAAAGDAQAAIDELMRQQEEANRLAAEQKSDRIRQAEFELARARSASAEGFGMLFREVAELGYLEGLDLSRIESNRAGRVAALGSQKEMTARGAKNTGDSLKRQAKAKQTAALLGSIGAGIQIGAKAQNQNPSMVIDE